MGAWDPLGVWVSGTPGVWVSGTLPGIIRLLLLVQGVPSMRLDDGFTTHPLSLGHSDPLHGLARGPASKV
jgi:hypothetical protein